MKSAILTLSIIACVAPASAATLGYWSFENNVADSSGNGLTLSSDTTVASPAPSIVANSSFGSTVPQTGATNSYSASFSGGNYYLTDPSWALGSDFTIEAYIKPASLSTSSKTIAGEWDVRSTGSYQSSWKFYLNTNGTLGFSVSGTGINSYDVFTSTTLSVSTNVSYYISAVYDGGVVTFFLQDITNNGSLLTETVSLGTLKYTSVYTSAANFTIGDVWDNSSTNPGRQSSSQFAGLIDEVRLSDTALASNQLLVSSIPEPSAFAAISGLLGLGFAALRRRRAA